MDKFITIEYARMQEAIRQVANRSDNTLQEAEQSFQEAETALRNLRVFILEYHFKDSQEEIRFFKELKPRFLRELIYYKELFYIEAGKPVGDKDMQISYFKQELERIRQFFDRNQFLYMYSRMNKSNYDSLLFLREAEGRLLLPEYTSDMDPQFSTPGSYKFGKIQAYEHLKEFLEASVYKLNNYVVESGPLRQSENSWTDSKAALIELAYALHSRGSVNHGRGDVKQIIAGLELIFNVQVGNFYRTFQSMRIRKKNRTAYLDTLKESLVKRMDETDLQF